MILSLVLTISLVAFQRLVVAKTGSVAIEADAMHYRADVLVNVGVLATIALVAVTGWQVVDPLVGLLVAAYILVGAVRIARRSLHILLDRELDTPHREAIRTIAMRHPAVRGFHDLRTRFGGNRNFLQFHLELDPSMNLLTAHEIMDTVEADIRSVYPGSEIIIHADPEGVTEPRDTFD
jgi:ferrous-iron efflux pump FieF